MCGLKTCIHMDPVRNRLISMDALQHLIKYRRELIKLILSIEFMQAHYLAFEVLVLWRRLHVIYDHFL